MSFQQSPSAGAVEQPVASDIRTTTGDSGVLTRGYGAVVSIRAQLNVTAASGTTPTLNVVIQDTLDDTNWNTIGTFTQKTAVSREVINILPQKAESGTFQPLFSDRLRVLWTIGGTTPSFTFQVDWIVREPG